MVFGITRLGMISGSGGGGVPNRSLDFERSSSQYLSMSDANFGSFNRNKGTFSLWVKKVSDLGLSVYGALWTQFVSGSMSFALGFDAVARLRFDVSTNGGLTTNNGVLTTNVTYSNSTWYHIKALYDMQNATAANRLRLWVNGSEISSFADRTNPPQTAIYNSSAAVLIGRNEDDNTYHDGLIFQPAYFSGEDVDVSYLYNAGAPKDVTAISGLYSLLNTTDGSTITDDYVKTASWTNNNTVIKSTDVPA